MIVLAWASWLPCGVTADDASCEPEGEACEPAPAVQNSWVDASYEFVTLRTDALAVWLDSFFGTPTADRESADSVLRLRNELVLDQRDGSDFKVRLRGKVDLPQLDRRLSLVLSDRNDEHDEVIPDSVGRDDDIGLQLRLREDDGSRLWVSLGINSSFDLRTSLRYRHVHPFGDAWRLQWSEKLYYKQEDGFGLLTRTDLDYLLASDRLVRWTNQLDYGEETAGVEWGTGISYQIRLDSRQALSYFTSVSGETDPDYLTSSYGIGVRYRRNILRRWMFLEVEPAHFWRRRTLDTARDSVWMLTLRLEFREERRNRHGRKRHDEARAVD